MECLRSAQSTELNPAWNMGRPATVMPAPGETHLDRSGYTRKRFACADERKKAKVLALQGHVLDLQRQLEKMELERTHDRAQLETLRKFVHDPEPAAPSSSPESSYTGVALDAPDERLQGWRPSVPMTTGNRYELCEVAAAEVATVMTALRRAGAPFTTAAECRSLSAANMADFHEELVERVRTMLQSGAEVEGSAAARQLDWLILQRRNIWCMGAHAAVWRNSPGLYYALISEIIQRAVAMHGPPASDDFDVKLAAIALTDRQRRTIVAEAEEMREQLVAMFAKQRTLFAKLGAQPPAGPMAAPDNSVMLEVQDLVGQLGDVIGAFSARVWMHTTALQHARGLVATPYILCGVTVGAHLMAPRDGLMAACHAGSMLEVVEWLRSDDAAWSVGVTPEGVPAFDYLAEGVLA